MPGGHRPLRGSLHGLYVVIGSGLEGKRMNFDGAGLGHAAPHSISRARWGRGTLFDDAARREIITTDRSENAC